MLMYSYLVSDFPYEGADPQAQSTYADTLKKLYETRNEAIDVTTSNGDKLFAFDLLTHFDLIQGASVFFKFKDQDYDNFLNNFEYIAAIPAALRRSVKINYQYVLAEGASELPSAQDSVDKHLVSLLGNLYASEATLFESPDFSIPLVFDAYINHLLSKETLPSSKASLIIQKLSNIRLFLTNYQYTTSFPNIDDETLTALAGSLGSSHPQLEKFLIQIFAASNKVYTSSIRNNSFINHISGLKLNTGLIPADYQLLPEPRISTKPKDQKNKVNVAYGNLPEDIRYLLENSDDIVSDIQNSTFKQDEGEEKENVFGIVSRKDSPCPQDI